MKNHLNTSKNAFQHKDSNKDTQLLIECTLVGGLIPLMKIHYQNRIITAIFSRGIWNNIQAIEKQAQLIIEQQHLVKPFKTASNGQ